MTMMNDMIGKLQRCGAFFRKEGIDELARLLEDCALELENYSPYVLDLEDAAEISVVWMEKVGKADVEPRRIAMVGERVLTLIFGSSNVWFEDVSEYRSVWRCWNQWPTPEERRAVPWGAAC